MNNHNEIEKQGVESEDLEMDEFVAVAGTELTQHVPDGIYRVKDNVLYEITMNPLPDMIKAASLDNMTQHKIDISEHGVPLTAPANVVAESARTL